MKLSSIPYFLVIIINVSCVEKKESQDTVNTQVEHDIKVITQHLDDAELNTQLTECLAHYTDRAISMPEYQATLTGRNDIENYYREIFRKQQITTMRRQPREFIHLRNTIIVIGTFQREFKTLTKDSLITLKGKYWHVWVPEAGTFRIKGEAFGYFHSVDDPESLIISADQQQPDESEIQIEAPFELKAYNALMEKGVRQRNATLRVEFFTDDAIFYPFADSAVVGMKELEPYLTAYSNRGAVSIDSVFCYTLDFEKLGDYIVEYDMFKVKWSRSDNSGRTEGKGIRIWKRQDDGSLRLFREIGTHNYL